MFLEQRRSLLRLHLDLAAFAKRGGLEVIGQFTETASGTKSNRTVRNEVMARSQARKTDAVLAISGMTFELDSPHGRMMATILSGVVKFERDLISERVKSDWQRRGPVGENVAAK